MPLQRLIKMVWDISGICIHLCQRDDMVAQWPMRWRNLHISIHHSQWDGWKSTSITLWCMRSKEMHPCSPPQSLTIIICNVSINVFAWIGSPKIKRGFRLLMYLFILGWLCKTKQNYNHIASLSPWPNHKVFVPSACYLIWLFVCRERPALLPLNKVATMPMPWRFQIQFNFKFSFAICKYILDLIKGACYLTVCLQRAQRPFPPWTRWPAMPMPWRPELTAKNLIQVFCIYFV